MVGIKLHLTSFLILATLTCNSAFHHPNQINFLTLPSGAAGINCLSWRVAVETNNVQEWTSVPEECRTYVGHYMMGKQYHQDCDYVASLALAYAESLKLSGDGKDVWVFGIDETTLSNLPYYARSDVAFGALPFNSIKFNEWVAEGIAPALPATLRLYKGLLALGFKIVFLSETNEVLREVRIRNLKRAGYHTWEKLILKGESDPKSTVAFKSGKRRELEAAGYRISGNVGDEWSGLHGNPAGNRTFKVPNPMYYNA